MTFWLFLFLKAEKKSEELSLFSFRFDHVHKEFSENILSYQNFILSGFKEESFYLLNKQEDIDNYLQNLEAIQKELLVLEQHAKDYELGTYKEFEKLASKLSESTQLGFSLKNLMKYRGFKDYGLEGRMRDLAHLLENSYQIKRANILQLRRHEKDFLLRGETVYQTKFNELVENLVTKTDDHEVQDLIRKYAQLFNQYVDASNKLNFYQDTGLLGKIKNNHQDINNIFSEMKKKSSGRILKLNEQNSQYLIIQSLFFVIIAIAVSFYLARTLTHDIKLLDENFRYYIDSDFLQNGNKPTTTGNLKLSSTEIRRLFQNFQLFKEKLDKTLHSLNKEVEKSARVADYKTRFLANMSHEIRTPLNGILGMLQLIKIEKLSERQQQNLGIAEYSAKHLLELVNMILDYSKLEVGKMKVEIKPVNLELIVQNIKGIFIYQAKEKNVELKIIYPEDVPQNIKADSMKIQQVLMNLISNAIKFTNTGNVVLKITKIAEAKEDLLLKFEVIDTGVGISKDDQKRLFEAFEQQDSSTTRKYGGTGLGLTITNQLVELMGGKLLLKSQKNRGSRFYFELRTEKLKKSDEHAIYIGPSQELSIKINAHEILVVEDNKINQLIITKMLQELGININIAKDGKEAYKLFLKHNYDLILMDIHMPEMNGLEATKLIKSHPKYLLNKPTIIATTASAFDEDKEEAFAHGMDDFLTKPILFQNLLEMIKKYLPHLMLKKNEKKIEEHV